MRYPVKSVQVAKETGIRTRSRMVSEALLTMWLVKDLPLAELLARVMPWLRKKLLFDAPKVGTSSRRKLDVVTGILLTDGGGYFRLGKVNGTLLQPEDPSNERGKEPSQAYRQNLQHHDDATYVNLGTLSSSPERSRSACDQC